MTRQSSPAGKGWNIAIWCAQIALAALYLMAAYMKGLMPISDLAAMGLLWTSTAPVFLVRGIAFVEFLGAVGVILPAATRIMPKLTVWAAAGLLAIQALAIPFHLFRGEVGVLGFNLIYVALAVFVLWGRSRKAPIASRA
ncbi:DoxX family protein [Asticcacaulis excentricus]|uniref:DoxX family protein n=1 Tax=Asticcacaulis excentricus TaxID=78587 RepID=UPI000F83E23E|nr:DoxX family protein [Asticcacaulis excentricus]